MGLDNDTQGWIMTAVSGIGMQMYLTLDLHVLTDSKHVALEQV